MGNSRDEILVKHMLTRAGGAATLYDDLAYLIAPRSDLTGSVILQMARYDSTFLDETFGGDSDGTLFEMELINFSTATINGSVEGLKDGYTPGAFAVGTGAT